MDPRTLCKDCGSKWLPTSIGKLREFFARGIESGKGVPHTYAFRSNLAYSFQYLEYLVASKRDLDLTSALTKQINKSFIIAGCGLVEGILYFLIRSNNFHRENPWELVKEVKTNPFTTDGSELKIENHIFRKLDTPVEEQMSFDSMIKKCNNKKLLGNDHEIYKQLNYLRKMRNRIHLQTIESAYDHDWNKISTSDFELMSKVLFLVLTSSIFNPIADQKQFLAFLDV